MDLGSKIRELRKEKGMKQSELAEKAGLSRVSVGNYERNERIPDAEILSRLATALDSTPSELMGLSDTIKINEIKKIIDKINFEIQANTKTRVQMEYELQEILVALDSKEISEHREKELLNRINKILKNRESADLRDKLLKQFYMLNEKGKVKAIESIELLTKVPEYKDTKEGE